jgi:hypothetical protein
MNKSIVIFSLLAVLGLSACSDDRCPVEQIPENTFLELNFRAEAQGQSIWYFKDVDYPLGDTHIRISLLRFFLGDVTLLGPDGDTTVLDIHNVDFSLNQSDQTTADLGETVRIANPPVGLWTGIRFGIGVPGDLNRMSPADFPAGHPLSNPSEFWDAWNSYIFAKLEGQSDLDGDGDYADDNSSFLYHSGTQAQYVTLTFEEPFEVKPCQTARLDFGLDVPHLFYNATDTLDLVNNTFNHAGDPDDPDFAFTSFVMENFRSAIRWKN